MGAGPAGLTAAYDLVRNGYDVTVFDRDTVPGGMMHWAIPEYRLPKDVLQREIQEILDLGIEFRGGVTFGRDLTLEDLERDGYQAVFLAIGCQAGMALDCPGADAEGVLDAVKFLRDIAAGQAPAVGKSVAVIGGGDSAIDAARSALRLGAEEVHLVYRRTREEMPAHPQEIAEAEHEGVKLHFLAAPKEILTSNGRVSALVCQQMRLGEFDSGGRRRPVPVEGAEFTLPVDTVIAAIGQQLVAEGIPVETSRGAVKVDPTTLATSLPHVFAGGDCIGGNMTVVDAIADGHRAARAIHSYLSGEPLPQPRKRRKTRVTAEVMAKLEEMGEQEMPPVQPRRIPDDCRCAGFAEVELGFPRELACLEAQRCLHCDYEMVEEEADVESSWRAQ
ncbi:MAG: FAD-dependent oxidoreductase [Armatimonadetes bacterium]|nr:FAD-dependent oxidoreductase [Armatimonadota bacterium]